MFKDNLQEQFLDIIRKKNGNNSGFVDDLADLLSISKDSAYRRLRGETPLHFFEIQKLSLHFEVSVDQLFNIDSSHLLFANRDIGENFTIKKYLISLLEDISNLISFKERQVIFAAKDIPLFHFFQFPLLTKFNLFFWYQNLENSSVFKKSKFKDFNNYDEVMGITANLWEKYIHLPSIEIWSDESVSLFLRRILFHFESGLLTQQEARALIDEFRELLEHAKMQAELSKKFNRNKENTGIDNSFHLYYNEVSISDNTVFCEMDGEALTFITYNMMSLLHTSDVGFCKKIKDHLDIIIKKSVLISSVSEKVRNKVFHGMFIKLDEAKDQIRL
ncbi:MAG: helix-turn-helix domain-containing protein [Cyclobacteriaceae bacterium]|nr:helix-turn-helix domain-containing protein [Cyclobacteriaceae bacterium]